MRKSKEYQIANKTRTLPPYNKRALLWREERRRRRIINQHKQGENPHHNSRASLDNLPPPRHTPHRIVQKFHESIDFNQDKMTLKRQKDMKQKPHARISSSTPLALAARSCTRWRTRGGLRRRARGWRRRRRARCGTAARVGGTIVSGCAYVRIVSCQSAAVGRESSVMNR